MTASNALAEALPPPAVATASRRSATRVLLSWLPRLLVALIFIYAGLGKAADPSTFAKEIRKYNMAPVELTNLLAGAVPALELATAGMLVLGICRREARLLLLLMLAGFTAAKCVMLMKGIDIACGCVPSDSKLAFLFKGEMGVATNAVLIACLFIDMAFTPKRRLPTAA
ncbi:DoxX [Phycisphaerae bacterium RAS1]|nr:DoxX [Phycisphaerae bacterium RAS1]